MGDLDQRSAVSEILTASAHEDSKRVRALAKARVEEAARREKEEACSCATRHP